MLLRLPVTIAMGCVGYVGLTSAAAFARLARKVVHGGVLCLFLWLATWLPSRMI